jgi:uncharacterized membrane protein
VSRFGKVLPVALAISVLLNVFLLGWGAVRVARRHRGEGRAPERQVAPVARELWAPHAPSLRARRRAIDARREAVAAALRREPFDPTILDASLLELRTATSEAQLELHQVLAELAQKLPVDEREHLASSRWVLGMGGYSSGGFR